MERNIKELRERIDSIDEKIIDLLAQRFEIAREVGKLKRQLNLKVEDSNREEAIVNRLSKHSDDPLTKQQISNIFTEIFKAAKEVQR